jgi:hypothetical protein
VIDTVTKNLRRFVAVFSLAAIPMANAYALQCAQTDSSGFVEITTEQPPSCSTFVLISSSDFDALRNPFTATPDFSMVRWSFGATLVFWCIGFGIGSIITLVRRAR